MVTRRGFLAGLMATGALPSATWADVGAPDFLSAAKLPNGNFVLCGIKRSGEIAFQLSLPARGHAAAAHPIKPIAVGFARRPGTFAFVMDCVEGTVLKKLSAPTGRHFYGHGTFTKDGALLFTTENNFEAASGIIGVWDVKQDYTRIAEFSSGGVGPHEILLMPDGETIVITNGGIETHPETGRTKLNLTTMQSNLSYLSLNGRVKHQLKLGDEHQRNSIRHIAVSKNGHVAFGMQWQGALTSDLPLVGVHNASTNRTSLMVESSVRHMNGYIGSIAISASGKHMAVTSPRAGKLQHFTNGVLSKENNIIDVCGIALDQGLPLATTGAGHIYSDTHILIRHPIMWDNHLVRI